MSRTIRWLWFLLPVLLGTGCALVRKPEPASPSHFLFVTARADDSYEKLARRHLADARLAWLIREANGGRPLRAGDTLIVPLRPWRRGGLTATGYQLVPVLSYHHFSHRTRKKLTTSEQDFESQLRYLRDNGYTVVGIDDFLAFLDFGALPRKAVMISIDDGWRSAYTIAYPLLRRFRAPAVLFLPSRYIDANSRRTMTWDMVREMVSDRGVDIQSHSKTHEDLTRWPRGASLRDYLRRLQQEIAGSRQAIEKAIGKAPYAMAYPFGRTNDVVIGLLQRNGFRLGFTVDRGGNPFFQDRFRLRRSMIYGDFDLERFARELVTFRQESLLPAEPIDTAASLEEILAVEPGTYEKRRQWRTALLAWRLYRDRWLEDRRRVVQAEARIRALEERLQVQARKYYRLARDSEDPRARRRNALRALLFDPGLEGACTLLATLSEHLVRYRAQAGDTAAGIAARFYGDPRYRALIPALNPELDAEGAVPEGTVVRLPRKLDFTREETPVATGQCRTPGRGAHRQAQALYEQALEFFGQDRIEAAKRLLERAVCLDPEHDLARELLEMLRKL